MEICGLHYNILIITFAALSAMADIKERCSSGLRGTPGKCVYLKGYPGFESLFLRSIQKSLYDRGFFNFSILKVSRKVRRVIANLPDGRQGRRKVFIIHFFGVLRSVVLKISYSL